MRRTVPTREITIIGAGPAGLGAAWALREAGHENFVVLEARECAGGLASSTQDAEGRWWDFGGHVFYMQDDDCGRVVSELFAPAELIEHPQRRFIDIGGRLIPYPVQSNIDAFSKADRDAIHRDQLRMPIEPRRDNFLVYLLDRYGPHLCDLFFLPFNRKRWGVPLETMSCDWLANVLTSKHTKKVYPREGGIGEIWRRLAATFGDKVQYGVRCQGQETGNIISTMPLTKLCEVIFDETLSLKYAGVWVSQHSGGLRSADADRIYYADAGTPHCRAAIGSPEDPYHITIEANADMMCHRTRHEHRAYPVPTLNRDTVVAEALRKLRKLNIWSVGRFGQWKFEKGHMHQCFAQGVKAAREVLECIK